MTPKKRSVGVRIPDHTLVQALLAALGEPLISTTLLLPGDVDPMTEGWLIKDELDQVLDAVIEGEAGSLPTTVVDFTSGLPEISRYGAGDPTRFE
jgi:tRNA A37 threonylcarbamoyladenosine synthetase subunit TsaC/SUA5/YrdC